MNPRPLQWKRRVLTTRAAREVPKEFTLLFNFIFKFLFIYFSLSLFPFNFSPSSSHFFFHRPVLSHHLSHFFSFLIKFILPSFLFLSLSSHSQLLFIFSPLRLALFSFIFHFSFPHPNPYLFLTVLHGQLLFISSPVSSSFYLHFQFLTLIVSVSHSIFHGRFIFSAPCLFFLSLSLPLLVSMPRQPLSPSFPFFLQVHTPSPLFLPVFRGQFLFLSPLSLPFSFTRTATPSAPFPTQPPPTQCRFSPQLFLRLLILLADSPSYHFPRGGFFPRLSQPRPPATAALSPQVWPLLFPLRETPPLAPFPAFFTRSTRMRTPRASARGAGSRMEGLAGQTSIAPRRVTSQARCVC